MFFYEQMGNKNKATKQERTHKIPLIIGGYPNAVNPKNREVIHTIDPEKTLKCLLEAFDGSLEKLENYLVMNELCVALQPMVKGNNKN